MYRIGIDLGGTNIKAGVVDEDGNILLKSSIPTGAQRHYSEIIRDMAEMVKDMLHEMGIPLYDLKSVGIGSPGSCDNRTGILHYANNLDFNDVPIRDEMRKYIDAPVNIGNDANCAALGEYHGLSEKVDNLVFITLGTGVGGGVIINGSLYTGTNGAAAELGHSMLVRGGRPCTCGRNGCWEAYASVTALISMTNEYIENNPDCDFAKQYGGTVSGKTAFMAAREGDPDAKKIVDEWISYVGEGVVDMVNIFQPDVLFIGGAISREGDYLLNPIRKLVVEKSYKTGKGYPEILAARLGNDAGLIGAAFL